MSQKHEKRMGRVSPCFAKGNITGRQQRLWTHLGWRGNVGVSPTLVSPSDSQSVRTVGDGDGLDGKWC